MWQAIVHNKGGFCSEEHLNNFMVDTKMIGGIPSEEQLLAALDLFKQKWLRKEKQMLQSWMHL